MSHVFPRNCKTKLPLAVQGDGVYIIDGTGKRYLDGSGGAAVSCLGHSDAQVIEAVQAQIEQLEARLKGARFHLENCTVRAPFAGRVPKILLKPGVQVSPARAVLTFVDTEQLEIFAIFPQKALQNVTVGDRVTVLVLV